VNAEMFPQNASRLDRCRIRKSFDARRLPSHNARAKGKNHDVEVPALYPVDGFLWLHARELWLQFEHSGPNDRQRVIELGLVRIGRVIELVEFFQQWLVIGHRFEQ
jgi:hypothetical protein